MVFRVGCFGGKKTSCSDKRGCAGIGAPSFVFGCIPVLTAWMEYSDLPLDLQRWGCTRFL